MTIHSKHDFDADMNAFLRRHTELFEKLAEVFDAKAQRESRAPKFERYDPCGDTSPLIEGTYRVIGQRPG